MILEDNGNVKDGALLACMAAWKDTKLPQVGKDLIENQGKIWWKSSSGPVTSLGGKSDGCTDTKADNDSNSNQRDYQISLTMGVWVHPTEKKTFLLADPSSDEEPHVEGIITIIVSLGTEKVKADYNGKVPLTAKDMALAAKLARGRAKEVAKILS